MKHLLNVWAWALAHWDVVLSLLGLLAYAWLNAANARTAIEKRAGSKLLAIIDRIAVLTMKGAANRASAPVLGKSIADDLRAQLGTVRDEPLAGTGEGVQINSDGTPPIRRETQAPPPPSEPGFVERSILLVVGGVAALVLGVMMLAGCSAGQTPVLSPISPRVIERAEYGTCAETGGKVEIPSAGQIALLTSVCWLRADSGAALDASPEPEPAVVADKSDAGAAVDAGAVE